MTFPAQELTDLINAIVQFVGATSILVAALRGVVPKLERWAESTVNTTDNEAVAWFANVLHVTAACIDWARSGLEYVALNQWPKKPGSK